MIERVQDPIYQLRCDLPDCGRAFRSRHDHLEYYARKDAKAAGWQVKPNYGKGSRKGLDLCPAHRTEPAVA